MDYYEILGIARDASKADVKKAFRKLAHQHHPDKGGDESKFKKINEAYQTLSDDSRRKQYDSFGSGGPQGFDFTGYGNGGGDSGFDVNDIFRQAGFNGGGDMGDIFETFFGGATSRSGARKPRGRDISIDIELSFNEAVFGTDRSVLVNKIATCDDCAGSGAKKGTSLKKCASCGGRGRVQESRRSILGSIVQESICSNCNGSGEIPETKCSACGGAGVLRKAEEAKIRIPAGIDSNEMIRLTGKGEAVPRGIAGELYVKVHIASHPIFHRDGKNLLMELQIKISEALLGTEKTIKTLDGSIVLKIPERVTHGEILRVRERGVPFGDGRRGDLLVKIKQEMPAKISKKMKELIEQLANEGI